MFHTVPLKLKTITPTSQNAYRITMRTNMQ